MIGEDGRKKRGPVMLSRHQVAIQMAQHKAASTKGTPITTPVNSDDEDEMTEDQRIRSVTWHQPNEERVGQEARIQLSSQGKRMRLWHGAALPRPELFSFHPRVVFSGCPKTARS
jgi:hypothetical protein